MTKKTIWYVGKHQANGAYEVEEKTADELLKHKNWILNKKENLLGFKVKQNLVLPIRNNLFKDTQQWCKKHNVPYKKEWNEVELLEEIYKYFGREYRGN